MDWLNLGKILSYLICFSDNETEEDENDVEEETISEQLTDEAAHDSSGTNCSVGPETGKIICNS